MNSNCISTVIDKLHDTSLYQQWKPRDLGLANVLALVSCLEIIL